MSEVTTDELCGLKEMLDAVYQRHLTGYLVEHRCGHLCQYEATTDRYKEMVANGELVECRAAPCPTCCS